MSENKQGENNPRFDKGVERICKNCGKEIHWATPVNAWLQQLCFSCWEEQGKPHPLHSNRKSKLE